MEIRWKIAQYFEAWWWKRYLSKKPVEEYLKWKEAYWQSFLMREKIEVSPTERILDAGCGPVGIFIMFPKNEITAIDPLLEKYETELPHFKQDHYPNVVFKKNKLEQFETKNNFDKIFCLNAINHVDNLKNSLKKLCGALNEKGTIYLSIDVHNFLFFKKLFRLIPGDILHPHQLDLKEYILLLKKNGIKINKISLLKKGFVFNYHLIIGQKTQ